MILGLIIFLVFMYKNGPTFAQIEKGTKNTIKKSFMKKILTQLIKSNH